ESTRCLIFEPCYNKRVGTCPAAKGGDRQSRIKEMASMSGTKYAMGEYLAHVTRQALGKWDETGTPYFYLNLQILARYDKQGREQPLGPNDPVNLFLYRDLETDVDAYVVKRDLEALGVEVERPSQLVLATPGFVNLVGRLVDVTFDEKKHQRNRRE